MKRRSFLAQAAVGLGAACTQVQGKGPGKENGSAVLRLSCQETVVPGRDLDEKIGRLARWGFEGLELVGSLEGKALPSRVKSITKTLKGTGMRVSAVCGGYEGALCHHDPGMRKRALRSIKELLRAAGDLKATGVIVVPALKGQKPKLNTWEARGLLVDLLTELGEVAQGCGTEVILEPLNRKETIYVRLLADAAAIVRDVGKGAVSMMGDFYHMETEETSDCGAFISAGRFLSHVHLAGRRRVLPGQDERDFHEGFLGLKAIGYHGFCSLDCAVEGDPEAEIRKSASFLRKQWEEASA